MRPPLCTRSRRTLPQVVCLTLFGPADAREAGKYTIALSYFLLAFANVVCQGFLDIHTITDNLCGNGPAPFPLRAQIVSLINCTGGILAMSNTFGSRGVADKGSKPAAGAPQPGDARGASTPRGAFAVAGANGENNKLRCAPQMPRRPGARERSRGRARRCRSECRGAQAGAGAS